MKAIEVAHFGGPETLQIAEKPTPEPGKGQILIEVKAAGINFADIMAREGHYPPVASTPFVPGFEAAGVIAKVGEGVTNWKPGDRVVSMVSDGYAEYALADAATAASVPETLGFAEATALLIQGLTAYTLMTVAVPEIQGKSVLISAAAGGVGSLAVQIAKLLGAGTVIGLASTEEKRAKVVELGADAAIDYTQKDWAERVKEATGGKGVDIYLDASGDIENGALKPVAKGGHWVVFGAQKTSTHGLPESDMMGMVFNGQTLRGYTLYEATPEVTAAALKQLIAWAVAGKLTIIAKDKFSLTDAGKAHEAIIGRKTTGKVVLEPS
jgi:NADPH2:quinone reductase